MSQHRSACIPPPTDYSSRRGPAENSRHGRGGRRRHDRPAHHHRTTFHSDKSSCDDLKAQNQHRDKFHEEDDYFAHIQDDDSEEAGGNVVNDNNNDDEDEDDPLDAYMKSLESDKKSEKPKSESVVADETDPDRLEEQKDTLNDTTVDTKGVRLDIDDTDDVVESYYHYVEETRRKQSQETELCESDERQDLVEYDKDGNVLSVKKVKRDIDPLPLIDHSAMNYASFEKNFYTEHEDIARLDDDQTEQLRAKLEIKVSGNSPPRPVCSFAHFKFDEKLLRVIRRSEYTQPTPIQAQAIPAALLGRNIIGIAMTGSGKTAAYLWPMIVHIMHQPELKKGDGPIGLVLVPTRELALQVYGEAKKFSNSYNLAAICAYGGGSKYEQSRDLESGAEIVVATPGRLIDLVSNGSTNLTRVTYLVLDEADRFFEMGFEAQVRSICDRVRPDRQTLLFSATFKPKIELLALSVTKDPVKIIQKTLGEVNEDVTQHVIILPDGDKKWDWLSDRLVEFTSSGSVLIFVTRIVNSELVHKKLIELGNKPLLLHGDMDQSERNRVITAFKRKECHIMIATDVAARGLDISHIRTVINYDVARDIDTHIHRIGRTGRAGCKGDAYTLLTDKDKDFAGHLVKNLEMSGQKAEDDLIRLAMQSSLFRKMRSKKHQRHKNSVSPNTGRYRSDTQDRQSHRDHHDHHYQQPHHYSRDDRHYDTHYSSTSSRPSHSSSYGSYQHHHHSNRYRYDPSRHQGRDRGNRHEFDLNQSKRPRTS